jgi:hypothetical protein
MPVLSPPRLQTATPGGTKIQFLGRVLESLGHQKKAPLVRYRLLVLVAQAGPKGIDSVDIQNLTRFTCDTNLSLMAKDGWITIQHAVRKGPRGRRRFTITPAGEALLSELLA